MSDLAPRAGPPALPALPAGLAPLEFLVGVWEGWGAGLWVSDPPLRYRERLTVSCDGRPLLRYRQETWSGEPPAPLHTEVGFIRPLGDREAELILVQAAGIVEIDRGPLSDLGIDLAAVAVHPEPSGLAVTAVRRRYRRDGSRLHVLVQIGMHGGDPQDHVRALLQRVTDPAPPPSPPDQGAPG